MSVNSGRMIQIQFSGDVEYSQQFSAADSNAGSGQNQILALFAGDNTITPPTDAVGVTIIPIQPADVDPVGLTLKGVDGDTGIALHLTDPTSIGLATDDDFVLFADGDQLSVRLIYN